MRRPVSTILTLAALAAGAALAGAAPLHAQGRATATIKRPPIDARTAAERALGRSGMGGGVIIIGSDRRGTGYGSGTVVGGGRGYDGCGVWIGGRGYQIDREAGVRGVDPGVSIGFPTGRQLGSTPLFWHADHLGARDGRSGTGCAVGYSQSDGSSHGIFHRSLEQEHARWHAGNPRRGDGDRRWAREHDQLHERLDGRHARWHASHSYDWSTDHGATAPHARGVLGSGGR